MNSVESERRKMEMQIFSECFWQFRTSLNPKIKRQALAVWSWLCLLYPGTYLLLILPFTHPRPDDALWWCRITE